MLPKTVSEKYTLHPLSESPDFMSSFMRLISHEIRNSLAIISMSLVQIEPSEDQAFFKDAAQRGNDKVSKLISELVDGYSLDDKTPTTPFDLSEWLTELKKNLDPIVAGTEFPTADEAASCRLKIDERLAQHLTSSLSMLVDHLKTQNVEQEDVLVRIQLERECILVSFRLPISKVDDYSAADFFTPFAFKLGSTDGLDALRLMRAIHLSEGHILLNKSNKRQVSFTLPITHCR